ncbi:apoptotic chromatin condensation inducer 1b isoform X2 [Festucalex cinctus]
MADEDITLDGQPLQSLRVADLKAALEQRNLSKSGAKNKLIQRLKGALMLENLQKSSASHSGRQPNSQIGEEMSQNSFIQQYLAKQQELLRHRLQREAQLEEGNDESPAIPEEDEDQSDNDSSSCVSEKDHPMAERAGSLRGEGTTSHRPDDHLEAPSGKLQRATFPQGHKEPPAPSPPRAVASLSVRVLGQPDRQGLPPALSRAQEKEGVAPSETGSAHSILHLSRSAGVSAGGRVQEDSDDEDDDDNDDSGDDEDWGPGPGGARKCSRAPGQPSQMPASSVRSKRKLQPPQHIPPPQPHQNLMQLRHPTPPPSPPPDLFPLPDTPKQSPPDTDDKDGECSNAPRGGPPHTSQRRDPNSRSRSSSPEPPVKRRAGPLSLLVHKMESEEAQTSAGTSESPEGNETKGKDQSDRKEEDTKVRDEEQLDEKKQAADDNRKVGGRDSGSSSDSDSQSDSSSKSSSSSSGRVQSRRVRQPKRAELGQHADDETKGTGTEKGHLLKREVSEPSEAAVSEVEPRLESGDAQQSAPGAEPVDGEGCLEESTTPKAFAARKISLTSNKMPPVNADRGAGDADTGVAAGRKRRWGSSTTVTAKKPSISITTDSLKSLIPDIKIAQDALVDLHPEELQLSGDEDNRDNGQGDNDDGLKIRRTVTQVVPGDSQENGRGEEEVEEEDMETAQREIPRPTLVDLSKQTPPEKPPEKIDGELKKATPNDGLVRRSISQQRSGVSITIDDPIRSTRQPSPPRGKLSNIIHVTNLVRPFTLGQLKQLLKQTGNVVEEGFWIDKIKSHCYVTYTTTEEAAATREALHGVKWPQSNPKVLSVDFCQQDELDFHKGLLKPNHVEPQVPQPVPPPLSRPPPLMPERDKEREQERDRHRDRDRERERGPVGVRDLWAERQRQMERRERARGEREWDRDKIREFARPGPDKGERRSRSRERERERRKRERPKSKERKTDKKEKTDEPPAKLLDDLFLKTKAAPCIYWLPLTEEQAAQRVLERSERQKERERRLKEQQDEQEKVREERKKERLKAREKEGRGAVAGATASGRGGDADRDKERGRNKDGERRQEGERRPARPPTGRRSRSCSDTRDRRR